jgi:hypothetical protein
MEKRSLADVWRDTGRRILDVAESDHAEASS